MKRGDLYIRITTAVLFLAVVCYLGVYIYNAVMNTYVTTAAISYDIEDVFAADGYIVRTESVVTDSGDTILSIVGEGEKVSKGQAIAVEYLNRDALELAGEIRALRLRIANLESSSASIESARLGSVTALALAVNRGDMSRLDALSLDIQTTIFSANATTEDDIPSLYAQLDALERRGTGMRTIIAPVSGVFSHVIDGYERITPDMLGELYPAGLAGLFDKKSGVQGSGKLVTEFTWYYASVMNAGEALNLPVGGKVVVHFAGIYSSKVEMLVDSVGRRIDGECVVVFSCDKGVHDVAQLREMRAEIVSNTYSGIRVPKEAVHLDDGGTPFIYLQTGVRAERVNIEILREAGDSYLVRDGIENGTPLRAGATIIVRANKLYDGKIVA